MMQVNNIIECLYLHANLSASMVFSHFCFKERQRGGVGQSHRDRERDRKEGSGGQTDRETDREEGSGGQITGRERGGFGRSDRDRETDREEGSGGQTETGRETSLSQVGSTAVICCMHTSI